MKNHSHFPLNDYVKRRNSTILFSVLVILFSFFFFRGNAKPGIYIEFRSDSLYLTCQNEDELSISFDAITGLELTDTFDAGTLVNGTDTAKLRGGTWTNSLLGNYHSYLQKSIPNCIILTTDADCIVFNYESSSVTSEIYTSFKDLLESKGFAGNISFAS